MTGLWRVLMKNILEKFALVGRSPGLKMEQTGQSGPSADLLGYSLGGAASLNYAGKDFELPVFAGTQGPNVVDIRKLYDQADVIGYAGWGSNDSNRHRRFLGFHWLPGAIMTEFVSTNGRTFATPPADWNISQCEREIGCRAPEASVGKEGRPAERNRGIGHPADGGAETDDVAPCSGIAQ